MWIGNTVLAQEEITPVVLPEPTPIIITDPHPEPEPCYTGLSFRSFVNPCEVIIHPEPLPDRPIDEVICIPEFILEREIVTEICYPVIIEDLPPIDPDYPPREPDLPPVDQDPPVEIPTEPKPIDPIPEVPENPQPVEPKPENPENPKEPNLPPVDQNPPVEIPTDPKPVDPTPEVPEIPKEPTKPIIPITPIVEEPERPTTPTITTGWGGYVPTNPPTIVSTPPTNNEKVEIPKISEKPTPIIPETPLFNDLPKENIPETTPVINTPNIIKVGLPKTGAYEIDEIYKRANWIIKNKRVVTTLPKKETFKLAWTFEWELSKWLELLPKVDRNKDTYIILPTQGLIMPINTISENSKSWKRYLSWKNENFTTELQTGAILLPSLEKSTFWQFGNKVIWGHSSDLVKNKGRYKTHFQKIIELDQNEQVWIYKKIDGKFQRFVYKVNKSYNVDSENVDLIQTNNKDMLTLFTCTPIWGIKWRWIVEAELIEHGI